MGGSPQGQPSPTPLQTRVSPGAAYTACLQETSDLLGTLSPPPSSALCTSTVWGDSNRWGVQKEVSPSGAC